MLFPHSRPEDLIKEIRFFGCEPLINPYNKHQKLEQNNYSQYLEDYGSPSVPFNDLHFSPRQATLSIPFASNFI